jgi:hypothetical protein
VVVQSPVAAAELGLLMMLAPSTVRDRQVTTAVTLDRRNTVVLPKV